MPVRVLLLSLLAATAVRAQETPIARTSADAAPPAAQAGPPAGSIAPTTPAPARPASDPTQAQIDAWLKADADPVQPLDPRAAPSDDTLQPRRIHGEVGATVSNRGYGGYAAAAVPIGQASELDVAVSAAQVRTRWGKANPRSLSVGLFLDADDLARWISRDKCHVPRWGVRLPDDPQVQADGSCVRDTPAPPAPAP